LRRVLLTVNTILPVIPQRLKKKELRRERARRPGNLFNSFSNFDAHA
jgi:hypothetical protein